MRKTFSPWIVWLALMAVLLMASACGASSGTVYAKDFIPEHIEYHNVDEYMWVCKQNFDQKNNPGCTMSQQWVGSHKEPYTEPDCYWIGFKDTDGDKGEDCIGKTRWETIEIGDYYEKD